MTHTELCNAILATYSKGDVRLWLNPVGFAYSKDGRPIGRMGKKGQADCSGILNLGGMGVRLEIEAKVGKDKQREAQQIFENVVSKFGGIYILARGLEDVESAIQKFVGRFGHIYEAKTGKISPLRIT